MLQRARRDVIRRAAIATFTPLLVFAMIGLGFTGRAGAEVPPDGPKTAIDLARVARQLTDVETQLDVVTQRWQSAASTLAVTEGFIAQNRADQNVVVARLRARAADAYRRQGSTSVAPLDVARASDLASARQYATSASDVDSSDLDQLKQEGGRFEAARAQQAASRDDLAARKDELTARQSELAERQQRDRTLLDGWGAVPVMGDALLTAQQMADWYRSTGAVPQLAPGTTIDDLARYYIEEGDAEGVRGDMAFAQAMIETGSFRVAAGNNYSGIGVCDSCTGGYSFADPRDGVRAQIQLLRNYADPDSRASNLRYPPSPGLYGTDPEKAARLYDSFFLKGKAPLWNQMGNGNWATDPTYAAKVTGLFSRMLAFAAGHPS